MAYEEIKATPPRAESHPNTFGWFSMIGKFTSKVRMAWTGDAVISVPDIRTKGAEAAAEEDFEIS